MHVAIDRWCPYCSGVVVVGGDDAEGTYWCVTCQKAVDPVADDEDEPRADSQGVPQKPEFQGAASWRAWVAALGVSLVILGLVGFCGAAG
jgi:hypothetical protein